MLSGFYIAKLKVSDTARNGSVAQGLVGRVRLTSPLAFGALSSSSFVFPVVVAITAALIQYSTPRRRVVVVVVVVVTCPPSHSLYRAALVLFFVAALSGLSWTPAEEGWG